MRIFGGLFELFRVSGDYKLEHFLLDDSFLSLEIPLSSECMNKTQKVFCIPFCDFSVLR